MITDFMTRQSMVFHDVVFHDIVDLPHKKTFHGIFVT